jgi:translation elongation factor EF-Tu-like GTPase
MKWPWQRERTPDGTASEDVDALLAEANAASPTGPFAMVVEDVFTIKSRGTVATGKVGSGSVMVGQQVRIRRAGTVLSTTTVTGIEMFRRRQRRSAPRRCQRRQRHARRRPRVLTGLREAPA